jgi:hypothetical protein
MGRESESRKHRDYGPEVIGFIALAFLSAMSHLWYALIAVCILFALSGVILLLGKLAFPPSRTPTLTTGSELVNDRSAG